MFNTVLSAYPDSYNLKMQVRKSWKYPSVFAISYFVPEFCKFNYNYDRRACKRFLKQYLV